MGLNLDFSLAKARRELGYQPRWTFDQAMRGTVAWYRDRGHASSTPARAEGRTV